MLFVWPLRHIFPCMQPGSPHTEEIWRHCRPRFNDENVIKDLKDGYGFESFNVNNFWAIEAVLTMIALVFHNLIVVSQ